MGELIAGIIFLLLSIVIFIQTSQLPESQYDPLGPAGFPRLIVIFMGILAAALIIKKVRAKDFEKVEFNFKKLFKDYKLIFISLFNFLLYILLMRFIGFRISTFLFVFLTQYMIGPEEKSGKTYFIMTSIALFISLGAYYFFQSYLSVIFPPGIFFE